MPIAPPEWAQLSPTGKIPVVQEGNLVVRDSSLICAWLEREHPGQALYPKGREAWVKALWLEEYADSTLFPQVVHGLFFQTSTRISSPGWRSISARS